ncbi:hypothetical protein CR513_01346, partial [Mucuna pruriens]
MEILYQEINEIEPYKDDTIYVNKRQPHHSWVGLVDGLAIARIRVHQGQNNMKILDSLSKKRSKSNVKYPLALKIGESSHKRAKKSKKKPKAGLDGRF